MKNNTIKNQIKFLAITLASVILLAGCSLKKPVPKNWYDVTLETYREGFRTGWKDEQGLNITDEQKDPNNKFGYLLRDLDGDGASELLIGIIDDSTETKFTNIIIWHRDFGARVVFTTGEGYYLYLCDNNVIRQDSWYGSETQTQYMVYNSDENSFPIVDGGSNPQKVTLTPFE